MAVFRRYMGVLTLLLLPVLSLAQGGRAARLARELQLSYDFDKAALIFDSLLRITDDPAEKASLEQSLIECENGASLMEFAYEPRVVARRTVGRDDFFLYFKGLADSSWLAAPNSFVDRSHPFSNAVYAPANARYIAFSAPDKSGAWNVSVSSLEGSVWSAPKLLGEQCTSTGDEVMPIVSPDGKRVYFSSNGLFGIGGYDIYCCRWDERQGEWGEPENLGFPFSSPADDFLYVDTPDGKYTIFASNRSCPADSLTVYVLEFDNTRIHHAVDSVDEIRRIALLEPVEGYSEQTGTQNATTVETEESSDSDIYDRYFEAMAANRELQGRIRKLEQLQQETRKKYVVTEDSSELKKLEDALMEQDMSLIGLQQELSALSASIQAIEAEFIAQGKIFGMDKPDEEPAAEADQPEKFEFRKLSMAAPRSFDVEEPEVEFDYTFRIEDVSQFAVDNTLPEGLVYQIRLVTLSRKGKAADFKGLSPIFENKVNSSKYIYSAGIFTSYNEVLANLNTAKKRGFRSAEISAYNNGKSMDVKKARELEKKLRESTSWRVVIEGYETLPAALVSLIQENCTKDIAKSSEDGRQQYVIAPFNPRGQADKLAALLRQAGVDEVSVEQIR